MMKTKGPGCCYHRDVHSADRLKWQDNCKGELWMFGFHKGQCGVPSLVGHVSTILGSKYRKIDGAVDINAAVANAVDAQLEVQWHISAGQAHDLIETVAAALLAQFG